MTQATERFSNRVENYIRFRPRYPQAVIEVLRANCQLTDRDAIADIGSGTGILAEMFLRNGNLVYGVEPNRRMREAGERLLRGYERFKSINATAEETTLPSMSVDFVTAGQAFHWFDQTKARREFKRILKPEGWVALVWNERREDATPFARDYEQLLRSYGTDYEEVSHKRIDKETLQPFFGDDFHCETLENSQSFDFEGLRGRLLSSSYAPEAGHPQHAPMLLELQRIFDKYQENGQVTFEYDTNIYYGHLD
jgi:SAM-dependent methyltransferase